MAAVMAGLHVCGVKLAEMRMLVFGSGSAGTGIADQVRDAIAADSDKNKEDAAKQIWWASTSLCMLTYLTTAAGVSTNLDSCWNLKATI